jgi:hypothetical protein
MGGRSWIAWAVLVAVVLVISSIIVIVAESIGAIPPDFRPNR